MTETNFPYGLAYQQNCARYAVENGCKGNAMGVLYCLFHQSGLWDWSTGQTRREIAHRDIAKAMGGIDYKTVQKAITALRKAGVIDYADFKGKGTVWSNGEGKANRYKLLLPALTPTQKTGRGIPKKEEAPHPKNGKHLHPSIHSNGKKDPASRRGGQWPASPALPQTEEEQQLFSQWTNRMPFGEAKRLLQEHREKQAVAAE